MNPQENLADFQLGESFLIGVGPVLLVRGCDWTDYYEKIAPGQISPGELLLKTCDAISVVP